MQDTPTENPPQRQRVGPYVLLRPLGKGAFGEVWLAERQSAIASNQLAVKLPHGAVVDVDEIRQEASIWIRAGNHPNVLPMFEADVYDGRVVIVSELAPDGSLQQWMQKHDRRAPSVDAAVDMCMALLAGLEHLHVRGIVHRDLKPANVLMQGESPRIADFGLARILKRDAGASQIAGTPAYMAPEAFSGERSIQSDLWSVGVMLHELISGQLPFPGSDFMSLARAISFDRPLPLDDAVPASVQSIVAKALAKNATERFRSAAAMRAALRDGLRALDVPATANPVAPAPRGCRTVAVTGSFSAHPVRTARQIQTLLAPYCDCRTTWYCGTLGVVDLGAAEYLIGRGERVVAVARDELDISPRMPELLSQGNGALIMADDEQVNSVPGAPSRRDLYFAMRADLVIVLWDGTSNGTLRLLQWLREHGKDHVVGFV